MRGRILFLVGMLLSVCLLCTLPLRAEAADALPEGFSEAADVLPEEVVDTLPDGFFSSDPDTAGAAVKEAVGAEALLSVVLSLVGVEFSGAVRLLAVLCGLLILSSVVGAAERSFSSPSLSTAFGFCSTAAIFSAIVTLQLQQAEAVARFFDRLSSLMGAMIPVLGGLWAMGGNVATASAGTGTLYVFLTVCQRLCSLTVIPVCGVCTVMALCHALAPDAGVRGIAGAIKKIYTFSLGTVMTFLLTSLSLQTTLTASADSVTARAAKLAASTAIPIVGGAVGETLRTLSSGVQYMKGIVGVGGIVMLLLLVLPVLISLILTRLSFLLSVGVAELLGCDREARLLSELGSVWGTMIAVVAMSSVMFILALWLFIKTVVAVG